MTAGLYGRVSTVEQRPENQLVPLRAYAQKLGWEAIEFVDHGVSGAKDRRPQLNALMAAVRRRAVDVVVCTKLDRLARSVHHLVTLAQELEARHVGLVVLDQALDTTTSIGRLLFHVLAAIAEFERDLIRDRVKAGLERAKAHGVRLGRPMVNVAVERLVALHRDGLSLAEIARRTRCSRSTVRRRLREAHRGQGVNDGPSITGPGPAAHGSEPTCV